MAQIMRNSGLISHEPMNFQHGRSLNNEMKQKSLIGTLMSINDIFSSTDMAGSDLETNAHWEKDYI